MALRLQRKTLLFLLFIFIAILSIGTGVGLWYLNNQKNTVAPEDANAGSCEGVVIPSPGDNWVADGDVYCEESSNVCKQKFCFGGNCDLTGDQGPWWVEGGACSGGSTDAGNTDTGSTGDDPDSCQYPCGDCGGFCLDTSQPGGCLDQALDRAANNQCPGGVVTGSGCLPGYRSDGQGGCTCNSQSCQSCTYEGTLYKCSGLFDPSAGCQENGVEYPTGATISYEYPFCGIQQIDYCDGNFQSMVITDGCTEPPVIPPSTTDGNPPTTTTDGNPPTTTTDGTQPFCGDGVLDAGEQCDPASSTNSCGSGTCNAQCTCVTTTPPPNPVTVSGQVYCQDPGGQKYPVVGAQVFIHDAYTSNCPAGSGNCQWTATTDSTGRYSQVVPFRNDGSSYSNSVDVRVLSVPNSTLSTGQSYQNMRPNNGIAATLNTFAVNCTTSGGTSPSGCVPLGTLQICQNKSLDHTSGSYSYCGLEENTNPSAIDFKFTNCSVTVPACDSSCETDSDCSAAGANLICYNPDGQGTGSCRNPSCQTESDCTCATTNPAWDMDKDGVYVCQTDANSTYAKLDYTIRIKNTGTGVGTLTRVVDTLDSKVQPSWVITSSINPTGQLVGNVITWELNSTTGVFQPGETKEFKYSINVPAASSGTFTNVAEAFPTTGSNFEVTNVESVSCTPPVVPGTPTTPKTGLFDSTIVKLIAGLFVIAIAVAYAKYDSADGFVLRIFNKKFRLVYNRKKFEDRT